PCIGMGQAPSTDAVSLRTFNRNFYGRSGTASAQVYLCSPETAAVSALTGVITDPRTLDPIEVKMPESFTIDDNMIVPPPAPGEAGPVLLGPNIKPFPQNSALPELIEGQVLLTMEDNITTDHIMPSPAWLLPLRSNIPALSDHCLTPVDPTFPARAKEQKGGFLVAGENYGQGSSREHAALVPLYLGIKGVIALSFARIHMANLINSGILPLTFVNKDDYSKIKQGDQLVIENLTEQVLSGNELTVTNKTQDYSFPTRLDISDRLKKILLSGGLLPYTKANS
ncbi:MAG: aconitase family protein, partial [Peptococcia bacterium]